METRTYQVYKFMELSKEVQEKVIEKMKWQSQTIICLLLTGKLTKTNIKKELYTMENTIKETTQEKALRLYLESQTADREPLEDRIQEAKDLIERGCYLVLTNNEADEQAKDYILESAWAFRYSFLCAHSESIAEIPEKEYTEMAGRLCESFNKAVLAMIPDKDHFVKDAILCDGRGHFLSSYDGEENEIKIDGTWYFIYRTN